MDDLSEQVNYDSQDDHEQQNSKWTVERVLPSIIRRVQIFSPLYLAGNVKEWCRTGLFERLLILSRSGFSPPVRLHEV